MTMQELNTRVSDLRELRRMAAELAAEISATEDAIKGHMDALQVDTLTGTDYKVTWKPVTSARLDTTAFKKALPDLAAQFTKQVTTMRFVLSA